MFKSKRVRELEQQVSYLEAICEGRYKVIEALLNSRDKFLRKMKKPYTDCTFTAYWVDGDQIVMCKDNNSAAWSHGKDRFDAYLKMIDVRGAL